MNKKRQIEEMIKIDPLYERMGNSARYAAEIGVVFDYTSLDACQRVLEVVRDFSKYWRILHKITSPKGQHVHYNPTELCAKATAAQVTEAILKAHGVWEETNG